MRTPSGPPNQPSDLVFCSGMFGKLKLQMEIERTKGKMVVTSDTESNRESHLHPHPLKTHMDLFFNDPSHALRCSQSTTPEASTQDRVQLKNGVVRKRTKIRPKIVQPSSAQAPTSRVLSVIAPRALNRLKDSGERTIIEKRQLCIYRVMSDYPTI
uniref:Uncharacterized protein n=1 Tax=Solanum tuberosum TaxID=4113 RepID=M1DGF4_SOLTU